MVVIILFNEIAIMRLQNYSWYAEHTYAGVGLSVTYLSAVTTLLA